MKQLLAALLITFAASAASAKIQKVSNYWMDELTLYDVIWEDGAPAYEHWLTDNYVSAAAAGEWRIDKLKAAYKLNDVEYPGNNTVFYGENAAVILDLQDEYPEIAPIFTLIGPLTESWTEAFEEPDHHDDEYADVRYCEYSDYQAHLQCQDEGEYIVGTGGYIVRLYNGNYNDRTYIYIAETWENTSEVELLEYEGIEYIEFTWDIEVYDDDGNRTYVIYDELK